MKHAGSARVLFLLPWRPTMNPRNQTPTSIHVPRITRRGLIAMAAVPLLSGVLTPSGAVKANTCLRNMIGALETHGQWAGTPSWPLSIHSYLGVRSMASAYAEARGTERAERATQDALTKLEQHLAGALGAVVLVVGRPTSTLLRESKWALNEVRDALPVDAYYAFSPLSTNEYQEEIGVSVSLGW